MEPTLRVISLGAGVQSSTMAIMASEGMFSVIPDAAIFADTQMEPQAVYKWLDKLETFLHFPVYRVTAGNILDSVINATKAQGHFSSLPFWTENEGKARQHCTYDYKKLPIKKKKRELLGLSKGQRVPEGTIVESWIGISTDEAHRMKPGDDWWEVPRYPLIEKNISRDDCLNFLESRGLEAPKSRCKFCPNQDDNLWAQLKESPKEWAEVCEIDRMLRATGKLRGMDNHAFLHRSLIPLENVKLKPKAQVRQLKYLDPFGDDCWGMCGV